MGITSPYEFLTIFLFSFTPVVFPDIYLSSSVPSILIFNAPWVIYLNILYYTFTRINTYYFRKERRAMRYEKKIWIWETFVLKFLPQKKQKLFFFAFLKTQLLIKALSLFSSLRSLWKIQDLLDYSIGIVKLYQEIYYQGEQIKFLYRFKFMRERKILNIWGGSLCRRCNAFVNKSL